MTRGVEGTCLKGVRLEGTRAGVERLKDVMMGGVKGGAGGLECKGTKEWR